MKNWLLVLIAKNILVNVENILCDKCGSEMESLLK